MDSRNSTKKEAKLGGRVTKTVTGFGPCRVKSAFFFPREKKKLPVKAIFGLFVNFFTGNFFFFTGTFCLFLRFFTPNFFFSRVILWFLMVFSRAKNRFHGQQFDFFSREIFVFRNFYFFTGKFSGKKIHGQFIFFSRAFFPVFFTGKILGFFTGKV